MIVAMAVPAWADSASGRLGEDTDGSITVSNAVNGEKYTAYKILSLASFQDTQNDDGLHATDAYAYVVEVPAPSATASWYAFIKDAKAVDGTTALFDVDETPITLAGIAGKTYKVVKPTDAFLNPFEDNTSNGNSVKDETTAAQWTTTASVAQKFAREAVAYAKANNLTGTEVTASNGTASFTNLELGYYAIDSTLGSLCALDTTNKAATVKEKNAVPVIEKKVQEDQSLTQAQEDDKVTNYVDVNDASIGDTIHYKTQITVKKGAQSYVLDDTMGSGLKYVADSVKVWFVPKTSGNTDQTDSANWTELKANATVTADTATTDYTTTTYTSTTVGGFWENVEKNDNRGFTLTIKDPFLTFLSDRMDATVDNYKIVVEYDATLERGAAIDDTAAAANKNVTQLSYGDAVGNVNKTEEDYTYTATWSMDLFKFTNKNNSNVAVDGAHFQILKSDGSSVMQFVKTADGKYTYDSTVNKTYTPAANAKLDDITEVVESSVTYVDTLTTDDNGKLEIIGLDGDDYYLVETLAPKGYNTLTGKMKFHVMSLTDAALSTGNRYAYGKTNNYGTEYYTAGGVLYNLPDDKTTATGLNYDFLGTANSASLNQQIDVENTTTAELPSTGGMGTTVLYIVGGMLVILAGAYLFFSRKRTA